MDDEEGRCPSRRRARTAVPTDERVTPAKNGPLQVNALPKRKLFDKARKEVFLEWFAATSNATLSAAEAGICVETVYRHLQKDEAFRDAFERTLQLAYLRLEARTLQEAHSPAVRPAYEVGCGLDDAPAEEHFDPELALKLLREHDRRLGTTKPRAPRQINNRGATNAEIVEALAKRLKAFALRVQREGAVPAPSREGEE